MRAINGFHHRAERLERGFTLIELSIVILIIGILIVPMVRMYNIYLYDQASRTTKERVVLMSSAVAKFMTNESRYPCPARRDLDQTNAAFGMEFDNNCNPADISLAAGTCAASVRGIGGALCYKGTAGNRIFIGAIPIEAIRTSVGASLYSAEDIIDGWGHQLGYVVTEALTQEATYTPYGGKIRVLDENGNPTARMNDDAHCGRFAHGDDGNGAWNADGYQVATCGTAASAMDNNNCDDDTEFRIGLRNTQAGASHFDDLLRFSKTVESVFWAQNPSDQTSIYNLNTQNVVVGSVATPANKLEVTGGAIRNDNSTVITGTSSAPSTLCGTTPLGATGRCTLISRITGTGQIQCGATAASEVMSGLSYSATGTNRPGTTCRTATFTNAIPNQTCPTGTYVTGMWTDGNVICTTP